MVNLTPAMKDNVVIFIGVVCCIIAALVETGVFNG